MVLKTKPTSQNQPNRKAVITIVFFGFNHFLRFLFFPDWVLWKGFFKKNKWIVIQTFEEYYECILLIYLLMSGFYLAEKITYVNNVNKYFHTEFAY